MATQETTLADHQHDQEQEQQHIIDPQLEEGHGSAPAASEIHAAIESLNEINASNQAILEDLNLTGLLERLQTSVKLLIDSNRRQAEIVSSLLVTGRLPVAGNNESLAALAGAFGLGATSIASALETANTFLGIAGASYHPGGPHVDDGRGEWVPRAQLDALRQKVRFGSEMEDLNAVDERERGTNGEDDKPKKRRKRTMKLEHLVHKIANGRLGVEYTVQGFEVQGGKDVPEPAGENEQIQEGYLFRPNFKAEATSASVQPYLDTVTNDVYTQWESDYAAREGHQTRDAVSRAVGVYWLRLCNRYDEQLARGKGQVHRDEVTRRKQNQYRRQQSLLARRTIAFEQSPLNVCKLRALYRTLLVIDFTPATTERPEEGRAYTPEEWEVYRRLANNGKPWDAHEIIDIFWLSPTCRGLMNILDVSATDQAGRSKRKGRPKAPAPGFHLPPALWDRSKLPIIRPRDEDGLPIEGQPGIVLFKFHVDEAVQAENPEWAADLYANPPIPDEDDLLPSLAEVMTSPSFSHLGLAVKRLQQQCNLAHLSHEQIQAYQIEMERDGPAQMGIDNDGSGELPDDVGEQLQHLSAAAVDAAVGNTSDENLESLVALAAASPIRIPDLPPSTSITAAGSSLRARRQNKSKVSVPPGGAAMPVKRKRTDLDDDDEDHIEAGLERDHGFLATM